MHDTPNILFVMADQMSAKALPMYGHPVVKAKTLSRLAEQGVVFENAYCNSPLCGPSRTSMMTGQLPSHVGGYDNATVFPSSVPTFAHFLRRAGYRTCLSGKMHFAGPDQLHGYEERLTTDVYPADFSWTPNWAEPDAKVRFQDMQNVMETGPCLRSMQMDYDDDVGDLAKRWLYDRARDDADQPFMLTVSFTSPHDPYVARPEFWDMYKDADIDLPTVPPIPAEDLDAHSKRLHAHYSVCEADVTEAVIRRTRHGYYAAIEYIDDKLAQLVAVLEETGLDENTIVVFASDHGDMMGERGMYYKKCFWEWSLKVPLIVWAPGQIKAGRVKDTVSLVDLLPTFADIGGVLSDVAETDGDSLLPCLNGKPLGDRFVGAEYLAEGVFEPTFAMMRGPLKLHYSETDPLLLFDLESDPEEQTNLVDDPQYAQALAELIAASQDLWDAPALKAEILKDQNRRRMILGALSKGKPPTWDYQPYTDASKQFVRAGRWTVEVEADAHLDVKK